MRASSVSPLVAAATLFAALSTFTGLVVAEERIKGSEVPNSATYGDQLTPGERSGIVSEEDVNPNDGNASVPPSDLQGIIPDAADREKGDKTVNAPADGALPGDTAKKGGANKDEAEVILRQSKDNFRVGKQEYDRCVQQWDPQTQMTKQEWAQSCRTTLQYYPESSAQ
jgi:hypothetical protein